MRIVRLNGDLLKKTVNEILKVSELQGVPWSRYPELNRILKGFRPNELTVLSGHTGVGKTTFLCEYSLDLAEQGVSTMWGSFEMPLRKICRTILHQFAGESLSPSAPHRVVQWAAMFSETVPMCFMDCHGSQSESEIFKTMDEGVKQLGTSGNYFEERFQRQDRFVQKLRTFANERKVHLTVVVHPRKEDLDKRLTISSLYGGGKISQEADNVLLIQTETDTAYPKKYVQVVKNRYDGTLGSMDLVFHKDRLSYRPRPKQLLVPAEIRSSL
ncbi:Twinkle protein mitochondrial [Paragonimus heterotremus]|uniref:Twinkle protein mitochondrial n=1 Tax=Paragonimus heterotremus TaxID=100268 RepID=A0A8J4WK57_9TREM|nr:Twinkle protein mitochondrial [Paragonimus heterotremus]